MASADVALKVGKVYNFTRLDIVKGEKFTIFLTPDVDGETRWAFFNDPVLAVRVEGNVAEIEATELGISTVYIYQGTEDGGRGKIIMELTIKVVDSIVAPAAKIVGTVGEVKPKRVAA